MVIFDPSSRSVRLVQRLSALLARCQENNRQKYNGLLTNRYHCSTLLDFPKSSRQMSLRALFSEAILPVGRQGCDVLNKGDCFTEQRSQ